MAEKGFLSRSIEDRKNNSKTKTDRMILASGMAKPGWKSFAGHTCGGSMTGAIA
jgi:hypothetical protein